MKKVFRFLGVALLATTVCMSLASCGDKDEPAQEQNQGEPEPGPGPGPGPDPDPDTNPFEGMAEGEVKVNFQGHDTILAYPYINKYYEIPASNGLWAINFVGAKADAGNGNVSLPQARLVADLATGQELNPYLTWYMYSGPWNDLVVTYQSGAKDTFQVGNYFYDGATPVTVENFQYKALQKRVTAKVTVNMVNFNEATSGVENPTRETVIYYFYKFATDDQMPQQKSLSDLKFNAPIKLMGKKRAVYYSAL
ncbi:MAG: hypothetical protein IJQ89_06275 [Bacteroidales bacterium]|nr:hypothetical protein [Bacteroidales bacterium]